MARTTIELRIKRQDTPTAAPYWEEFSMPWRANMNVISCLMEIRKRPVTRAGQKTTPIAWDASCLEEVCGSCTMLVNGKPCQSCTQLVDKLPDAPIVLEPLTKFPIVRDLQVDRTRMFEGLKQVKAWIAIDGTHDLGPGPRVSESEREIAYAFSRCMTCGCCMEVCPQFNDRSDFIGPAPLAQVRLFNAHPTGHMNARERLESIMGRGGLSECGNAQNCVEVCPKEIPLTEAFGELGRQTTGLWLKKLFGG
ncbi:MAG: succinate dehydrogenase iron-sulfur subunit [Candidatus Eisenbacteria bacterium]|uniref:succinate dehydrogenase n=1 Tax=Eiseniibacteriota bacterium TaxID=2212470 RepID=A0A849SJQ8_UNCEI|nr:succinate dehydrogenase iron-sulfur subunit [Candidatus Eisenbacteria bacterium]